MVSLWVFIGVMDVYGCLWVSGWLRVYMGVYGCPRVFMRAYGYFWISWVHMVVYGCPWIYIGVYGCLWSAIGVFGFLDIYGNLWVSMGAYGYPGVYEYLWVAWVSMGIIFKHQQNCLFSRSRTPEDLKTSKNVWNHTCVIKNSVCATGERDFIGSCVFSTRQ